MAMWPEYVNTQCADTYILLVICAHCHNIVNLQTCKTVDAYGRATIHLVAHLYY